MATSLDPLGDAWYTTSLDKLQQAYGQGMAQNQFNQGVADQTYRERLAALQQQFGQRFDSVPGTFAARGLSNSGVYQNALQNLYANQATSVGNLTAQNQMQDQGYSQANQMLGDSYTSGSADLNTENQARQDQMAASLKAAAL